MQKGAKWWFHHTNRVIIDGIATQILRKLSEFLLPATIIEPAHNTTKQQYISSSIRLGPFIDDSFRAALSSASKNDFLVKILESEGVDTI